MLNEYGAITLDRGTRKHNRAFAPIAIPACDTAQVSGKKTGNPSFQVFIRAKTAFKVDFGIFRPLAQ